MLIPGHLLAKVAGRMRAAEVAAAEGAGHDVQHSRPEWLAHAILDWLGKH